MQRLREAPSAREADLALQQLLSALADLDGYPRQAAMSALSARLLRPGRWAAAARGWRLPRP
jgi:hypothetical protein